MKTNPFSKFITHDAVNNTSNRLASCTVPEHVSSIRESSVWFCVEGTIAIPDPNHSLNPECVYILGYVRSPFVLDSAINALSGSYPGTRLAKV